MDYLIKNGIIVEKAPEQKSRADLRLQAYGIRSIDIMPAHKAVSAVPQKAAAHLTGGIGAACDYGKMIGQEMGEQGLQKR